ncbi:MAG: PaaI family thioesterase [Syntrophomonadaceae bacterium]|nr:PaaI family thioesterase [Syntrophomonadaceae bacterium]
MKQILPENRGIEDNLFNAICTRFDELHAHQTFGISLTYMGPGTVGMKMITGQEFTTVQTRLHGGVIAALLDTAMGQAVVSLGKVGTVTLDMSLNYLAPVFLGTELEAEGNVIHAGRSTAVTEANVYDNNGKLVATSRGTFFVTNKPDITGAS